MRQSASAHERHLLKLGRWWYLGFPLRAKSGLWVDVCVCLLPPTNNIWWNWVAEESLNPFKLPGTRRLQMPSRDAWQHGLNRAMGTVSLRAKSSLWVDLYVCQLTPMNGIWLKLGRWGFPGSPQALRHPRRANAVLGCVSKRPWIEVGGLLALGPKAACGWAYGSVGSRPRTVFGRNWVARDFLSPPELPGTRGVQMPFWDVWQQGLESS